MGFGGAEKKIVELSNGLCEKGFKIAVLVFDKKDKKGVRIKDLSPEVRIIAPPPYRNHPAISLRRGTYETIKAVREWKPHVVYSNLWNTNPFVAVVGKLFGAKVILEESVSVVPQIERKKYRTLARLYRKSIYGLADAVVAVSQGLTREVKRIFGLEHVKTIYNCIDIESVIARSKTADDNPPHEYFRLGLPILVATGRLDEQKGYPHLLEAFKIVNETVDARLVIVGDGKLKDELRRTAKSMEIDDKIAMVGETEPYAYMCHGDIFVFSSLYEGFGIVLIEAMSLGMPVVSTDCDYGPNEIIENGKNGLLVPVADPEKMASEILRLIKDKNLRSSLGAEARKRSKYFALDRMVSDYEKVLAGF